MRAFLVVSKFLMLAVLAGALTVQAADSDDSVELGGKKLVLNGVGLARELSGELYIGALYVDQKTNNPAYLTRIDVPKRLAFRIVADRLFGRRLGQILREQILINNERKDVQASADEVLDLVDTFSGNLVAGDQLHFDFQPGKGTRITLNGSELTVIRKPELIALLANYWIGPRPPNSQFKLGVMGDADKASSVALLERFRGVKPSAARVAESRTFGKKDEAAAAAVKPELKPEPKPEVKPEIKPEPKPAKPEPKVEPKKEEPKKEEPKKEEPKPVVTAPVVAVPPAAPVSEQVVTAADGTEMTSRTTETAASDRLAEYQLRRDYERKLLSHIGQFKEYPWERLRRKYGSDLLYNPKQGKATVRVSITREGLVKSARIEQSAGDRILDEAALNMVDKAVPLPAMPDKLTDADFEFYVEVMMSPGKLN